jgi:hypothetical protein
MSSSPIEIVFTVAINRFAGTTLVVLFSTLEWLIALPPLAVTDNQIH